MWAGNKDTFPVIYVYGMDINDYKWLTFTEMLFWWNDNLPENKCYILQNFIQNREKRKTFAFLLGRIVSQLKCTHFK